MKTWITTDTHFKHQTMIRKGFRPSDYEEQIVLNWRRMIGANDTVIHLGDVICGEYSDLVQILLPLPGRKILVRGNHDQGKSITWYNQNGFDFVCDSLRIHNLLFTHEPTHEEPWTKEEGAKDWVLNVHGHLHSDGHRDAEYDLNVWHYLVSLEATDYKPVSLDSIYRSKEYELAITARKHYE